MLAHLVVLLLAAAQGVPAVAPPAAPAPAAPPVPHAPQPDVHPLDAAAFARTVDALQDVKPSTRLLAQLPRPIRAASIDLGGKAQRLTVRPIAEGLELVAQGAQDRSAVLATLRWRGTALEWSWLRTSVSGFADALRESDALLPGALIEVQLEDGSRTTLMAEPVVLRGVLQRGTPLRLRLPALSVRALVPAIEENTTPGATAWQLSATGEPGAFLLTGSEVEVRILLDAAHGSLTVECGSPVNLELREAKKQIADLRKEAQRRTEEERTIIQAQIETISRRIQQLEAAARATKAPLPSIPKVWLQDAAGRVHGVLEIATR